VKTKTGRLLTGNQRAIEQNNSKEKLISYGTSGNSHLDCEHCWRIFPQLSFFFLFSQMLKVIEGKQFRLLLAQGVPVFKYMCGFIRKM
jgi:hypothetical protein